MDIDISSLELALKTLITEFYPFTDDGGEEQSPPLL